MWIAQTKSGFLGSGKCVDWGKRKGHRVPRPRASSHSTPSVPWALGRAGSGYLQEIPGNQLSQPQEVLLPQGGVNWKLGWGFEWSSRNSRPGYEDHPLPWGTGSTAAWDPKMLAGPSESNPQETAEHRPACECFILNFGFQRHYYQGLDLTLLCVTCLCSMSSSSSQRLPIIWGNSEHYFFIFFLPLIFPSCILTAYKFQLHTWHIPTGY